MSRAMHTHTGFIVVKTNRKGRVGKNRHYAHHGAEDGAGKVHALTVEGNGYRALCGQWVERAYGNESDLDGPTTGHVRAIDEAHRVVTCRDCLRKLIA